MFHCVTRYTFQNIIKRHSQGRVKEDVIYNIRNCPVNYQITEIVDASDIVTST